MKTKYGQPILFLLSSVIITGITSPLFAGEADNRNNANTTSISSPVPLIGDKAQYFLFKTGLITSNYASSAQINEQSTSWLKSSFCLRFSPAPHLTTQLELPIINVIEENKNESAFAGVIGSLDWNLWQSELAGSLQSELFVGAQYSLLSPQLEQIFAPTLLLKQQDQISVNVGYRQIFSPAIGQLRLNVTQAYSQNTGFFYNPIVSPELLINAIIWPEVSAQLKANINWTLGTKNSSALTLNHNNGLDVWALGHWNFALTPSASYQLTKLMHIDLTFVVPLMQSAQYHPSFFSNPLMASLWGGEAELGIRLVL